MRGEMQHRAAASFGALQRLPAMLASGGAEVGAHLAQLAGLVRTGLGRVADTSFNQPIGPHRRVEWVSFELERVKEVKRRLGGTVNDVVLGIVGGGLRRVVCRAGDDPNGTLRALVPVSTRATSERGETGNRVSAWIADLPIDESRVLERHRRILATTAALRSNQDEQATSLLVETAEWTPPIAIAMSVRLLRQVRLFNVIVTNIPGPAFPLYLQDARMVEGHPHVPLFDNQGLGIALLSYDGRLSLGLVADWDVVHDLAQIADDMEAAFKELCDAAGMKERAEIAAPARSEPVADLQSSADVRTAGREPSGHVGAEEPVGAHAH